VSLRGVCLAAGARILLSDVDLSVRAGEFVAVVGPNGVGKSTLLRSIAGFARPLAGTIEIDGSDSGALSAHERAQRISLLGSDGEVPAGLSLREVAVTGRFARRPWWDWTRSDEDLRIAGAALERVDLGTAGERDFASLSSGERQRAWIALALAQEASTLLLDEPTSHLDARYALEILGLLRSLARGSTSVVAVLHDLNEAAAFADRVALLGEGRVLAYERPERALDPELLGRAYGVTFVRVAIEGEPRVFARAINPPRRQEGTLSDWQRARHDR
jgi:iron complex transport system ATP-binding protein